MTGQAWLPKWFSSWWWQKLADYSIHMLADQEVECLSQNQKWTSASNLPVSCDPLAPVRICFLAAPQPPKVATPAENKMFKCIRLLGNISNSNYNSIQQKYAH